MHYFFVDLFGAAAATALSVLLLLLPGFGITDLLVKTGVIAQSTRNRTCWSLFLGPVLLPAVDALLIRSTGIYGGLLLHILFAMLGARAGIETVRRLSRGWLLALLGCFVAAAWANVDFDWNGQLYQSVLVIDGVKHAAVIGALAHYGIPLRDPFFVRSGAAGYYYYFYIGPALVHWLAEPWIDSRAAFVGATVITLIAFPALLFLVADEAALIPEGKRRAYLKILCVLSCLSGFDLLPGLWIWARTGTALTQLDWWNEEVRWALSSALWVPHHILAVMAVYAGTVLIANNDNRHILTRSAVAGLAFGTAFGSSVWIVVAAFPILALWWLLERRRCGARGMWLLPLSGCTALIVSLPQLFDIRLGRAMEGPPLAFYMRPVGPIRVLPHSLGQWLMHLAVTPGGYLIEFGIFGIGALTFLARGRLSETRATGVGRMLLLGAPVALLLVTFFRSAILYNDFGWRAVWLAQAPTMLWTTSVLISRRETARRSAIWVAAFALGIAATAYDFVGLRFIRPVVFLNFINEYPEVTFDVRGAYRWTDNHLPANVLVQHNPGIARALDFGLYSDRPVAVADREARLFGAPQWAVLRRIALLQPIFLYPISDAELRRRAALTGVTGFLLTSADPLWRNHAGPPRNWTCEYRSANSCVMLLGTKQ